MMPRYLKPNWPAPNNVHAVCTTRQGGYSRANYQSFNLADHVADELTCVKRNREQLKSDLQLPSEPCWLEQIHSNKLVQARPFENKPQADASYTTAAGIVCAVLTADCLPILICNKTGSEVAAIHAGWRGLAAGIIGNTLKKLSSKPTELLAWLGPAIGPGAFEVGAEVYTAFCHNNSMAAQAFIAKANHTWNADLYALAKLELTRHGVKQIYSAQACTYSEAELFFSYRRDGQTGRMASLIWFD